MRSVEVIERELETERAFELCAQVEQYLELLDGAHGHRHARTPRSFVNVLQEIEWQRNRNGLLDAADCITAAFWALVPPAER